MKQLIVIAALLGCFTHILAQEPDFLLINEILLSTNNTVSIRSNTEGRFGFGFGVGHVQNINNNLDCTLRVEYNLLNTATGYEDGGMGGSIGIYDIKKKWIVFRSLLALDSRRERK